MLAQQISQLPGVAQVLVYGAQKFAVRVQVDPVAAAARNISLDDIRTRPRPRPIPTRRSARSSAPSRTSRCVATGAMRARGGLQQRRRRLAQRRAGQARRDRPRHRQRRERQDRELVQRRALDRARRSSGSPAPTPSRWSTPVESRLPQFRAQVPAVDQAWRSLIDRSISIRASVDDVQETLLIAIALVILVIFLFLRSASATIIPALAVPISLVGTCAAMYAFGFSINNMTLLALTLSVGFVVDDAIVMLENIVRHIEGGMRPFEAALKGAREIGFTIVSITFSLIAVFIPVLLMGGMVGRVFREFAVTIAVAIIISGFVSLTLTPMLCARVLRGHHEGERRSRTSCCASFEAHVPGLAAGLRMDARQGAQLQVDHAGGHVRDARRHGLALHRHPEGLLPERGHRLHAGDHRGAVRHLVPRMVERQRQVAEIVRKDPAVRLRQFDGRRRRPEPDHQQRPHVHRAQAASTSASQLDRGHPAPAPRRPTRSPACSVYLPERPEHQYRRPHLQEPVPVHAAIERHRGALPDRAGAARQDRQGAGPARRQHRPLHQAIRR